MNPTKNKKIILTAFLLLLILTPCLALADWEMPDATDYGDVPTELDKTVTKATNWLLGFVAALGVIMVVWGGINYLTSAGDEERVRTAKNTIKYGLMGVVIAGFAYAVVKVIVVTIL